MMNTCRRWSSLISRQVDDELPPGLRSGLADHLEACARCRESLCREKRASRSLRERLTAPHESLLDLESRVVASTTLIVREGEQSQGAGPRVPAPWQPLYAGGLAAAAAFAVGALAWITVFEDGLPDGSAPGESRRAPVDGANATTVVEPSVAGSHVIELRRDTRKLSPIPIFGATTPGDTGARTDMPRIDLPQIGLETLRTHSWIIEPRPSRSSPQASTPTGREPRWSIELEKVRTRLVRYETRPWY